MFNCCQNRLGSGWVGEPWVASNPKGLERVSLEAKLGHQARDIKNVEGDGLRKVVGLEAQSWEVKSVGEG